MSTDHLPDFDHDAAAAAPVAGSVVLAAGGTGGHLFPAQALAEELARRGHPVDLMTDMRGDRYGTSFPARSIHKVPAATLAGANPIAAARTLITLGRGVRAAKRILAEVRPSVVVGFGGYPSFPPIIAAGMLGIPTALHEQNAVLGRANRLLARRVTAVATSFEKVRFLEGPAREKARFTGNPVRDAVIDWSRTQYVPSSAGQPFNLLVFGGSQGARFFSDVMPPALAMLSDVQRRRLRLVLQSRPEDLDRTREAIAALEVSATIQPFFPDLPELMARAHLVIGRAGASSVAELAVLGRPSILVPLPHALDNDQLANATRLAEAGGAICMEQKDITPERLGTELARLMDAPQVLAVGAEAARKVGHPDAVERLADLVIELMAAEVRAVA